MSITRMVGADKAGQPNVVVNNGAVFQTKDPIYLETTHVGLVLWVGEHNFHDDSDFYAIVWNPIKGCPEEIEYATTRAWTYPNHAFVDATPEVKAAYQAYLGVEAEKARLERITIEAKTPGIGKKVRVVKGNKVAVGTEGVIFWVGLAKKYGPSRWVKPVTKIGIALDDTKDARGRYANVVWTYIDNVEVIAA